MDWIYLSPHLDDVALSLGGLLWEQSQAGERVAVWTICAGDPPAGDLSPFAESLHTRWGTGLASMQARRAEDIASCQQLGASYRHFDIPDCIYRRSPRTGEPLYASREALWNPLHPDEEALVEHVAEQIEALLPAPVNLVCPLTLGSHVDHRLARAAAEKLGLPLWFYADYPYALKTESPDVQQKLRSTRPALVLPISEAGLRAWQEAVAAHRSQISTFWKSLDEMRAAIREYCQQMGGARLLVYGAG